MKPIRAVLAMVGLDPPIEPFDPGACLAQIGSLRRDHQHGVQPFDRNDVDDAWCRPAAAQARCGISVPLPPGRMLYGVEDCANS